MEKQSTVGQPTDNNNTRRMRTACWITKATDTHSEYVILIVFRLQQWLHESASILRYMYFTKKIQQDATVYQNFYFIFI